MASLLDAGGGALGGDGGCGGGADGAGMHHNIRIHGLGDAEDANGVPVFNHSDPMDWVYRRAYYDDRKKKKEAIKKD